MDWFTADLHFGHRKILDYTNRPWTTIEEQTEGLVERWNGCVQPQDDVWVLGDFSFYNRETTRAIFHRLKGKKHLIEGNHDKSSRGLDMPWTSRDKIHVFKRGVLRAVLCHYPMVTWQQAQHGYWMLHGHCHGNLHIECPACCKDMPETTRLDVGVDTHDYQPYSLDEIEKIMAERKYHWMDHHQPKSVGALDGWLRVRAPFNHSQDGGA